MSEMPSIDTSGIDDLRKIKEEQDVFRDRLQKMQDMKEKVSPQVYEKVFNEYSTKLDALSQKAGPLKDKIREQYAGFKKILVEIEETLKTFGLEKEEMEFRFSLGEFDENAFNEQLRNWEMKNTSKQAELDDAQEMRSLFLSVFDSEEDLESAEELSTVPVDVTMALPGLDISKRQDAAAETQEMEHLVSADENLEIPEGDDDDLMSPPIVDDALEEIDDDDLVDEFEDSLEELSAPPEEFHEELADDLTEDSLDDLETDFTGDTEDVEPPPPPLPQLDSEPLIQEYNEDETLRTETPHLEDEDAAATLLMDQPPEPAGEGEEGDGTMIIANPKIISLNHATKGQVIVLGMGTTSLGRSPDNDIHLTEDRISRKHSQITFGPGGYAIYDLNSENGTFVNGNRIREHFLSDGDIITVGTFKYQYRDR